MGPRVHILTIIAVIIVGLAAPAVAAGNNSQNVTVQTLAEEAQKMLQPFAKQRNLTIRLEMPGMCPVATGEVERMRERVINLMANGIALSPENNTVVVKLNDSNELSVWVSNDQVAQSVDRDVRDQSGNFFKVRTLAGQGTVLSTRFVTPALGNAQ